jgi:hypothetical protein
MSNHTKEPWRVEIQSVSLGRYMISDAEDKIVLQLLPKSLAEQIVSEHNEIAQLRADRAELLKLVNELYARIDCSMEKHIEYENRLKELEAGE